MPAADLMSAIGQFSIRRSDTGKIDGQSVVFLALGLLCIAAPFDISQLLCAFIGAVAYAMVQAAASNSRRKPISAKDAPIVTCAKPMRPRASTLPPQPAPISQWRTQRTPAKLSRTKSAPQVAQPSAKPIVRPTFTATGWNAEVQELLSQIQPTPEGDRVVQQLAQIVKSALSRMVPDVQVVGFASGDLMRGLAFGVAVPEVDIVVNVRPQALVARLHPHSPNASTDARRLQKSAIRAFTDRLVSTNGFKFRRSAFRCQEPKVTLLAPAELGIHTGSIPIDLTVNSTTPLYSAALLTECGYMEPRAKSLILFVRRWAKDRGVCHAAKGHLSPYLWNLLTIYFLQVGVADEGPLLPPLENFEVSSGLLSGAPTGQSKTKAAWKPPVSEAPKKPVGELFKEFIQFYTEVFDWRDEAVSIRLARRAPPDVQLPLHIIVNEGEGAKTEVGPSIEDPFEKTRNLGSCMTAESLPRLREELARARGLCSCEASLAVLLDPWVPIERPGSEDKADDCEKEGNSGADATKEN